jgi:hypothetical protein
MRFLFNLIEVITGWASPCVHGVNSLSLIGITVIGTEVVDTISDIAYVHVSKGDPVNCFLIPSQVARSVCVQAAALSSVVLGTNLTALSKGRSYL